VWWKTNRQLCAGHDLAEENGTARRITDPNGQPLPILHRPKDGNILAIVRCLSEEVPRGVVALVPSDP